MTKRDYYTKVSSIVREAIIAMKLTDEEIDTKKNSLERMAKKYQKPILAEIEKAKWEREEIRQECLITVKRLSGEFIKVLEGEEAMNGRDVSEDIALIKSGVTIPASDLKHMAERSMKNPTMARIIMAYIADNGINADTETAAMLHKAANPNANAKRIAREFETTAKYMLEKRMYSQEGVYDQIIGKDSEAYAEYVGADVNGWE